MLKACWDCIASSTANREPAGNDEAYGIRLNGDTQRAPPWPEQRLQNENMFLLPKVLQVGDKVHVQGHMTGDRQRLTLNLVTGANGSPDYQNIACQVDVRFSEDRIVMQSVTNGNPDQTDYEPDPPSMIFSGSVFDFVFTLRYMSNLGVIEIDFGGSYLGKVDLKHRIESVRYLSVHGDVEKVEKLEFEFA